MFEPLLSSQDLAELRQELLDTILTDTITRIRITKVSNGAGGWREQTSEVDYKGHLRAQPLEAGVETFVASGGQVAALRYDLLTEVTADILEKDRVRINGITYEVNTVHQNQSFEIVKRVIVTKGG